MVSKSLRGLDTVIVLKIKYFLPVFITGWNLLS